MSYSHLNGMTGGTDTGMLPPSPRPAPPITGSTVNRRRLLAGVPSGLDRRGGLPPQAWTELLRRPVLPQAGDQGSLEREQGDLPHPLADLLGRVVKGRFPLGDRRPVVQVEVEQVAGDVCLPPDDLGLPVVPDAVAASDRFAHHPLVVRGARGQDAHDT